MNFSSTSNDTPYTSVGDTTSIGGTISVGGTTPGTSLAHTDVEVGLYEDFEADPTPRFNKFTPGASFEPNPSPEFKQPCSAPNCKKKSRMTGKNPLCHRCAGNNRGSGKIDAQVMTTCLGINGKACEIKTFKPSGLCSRCSATSVANTRWAKNASNYDGSQT